MAVSCWKVERGFGESLPVCPARTTQTDACGQVLTVCYFPSHTVRDRDRVAVPEVVTKCTSCVVETTRKERLYERKNVGIAHNTESILRVVNQIDPEK